MQLKLKIMGLFVASLFLLTGCQSKSPGKPNILWITIEDTSPHFIGCYGNKDAKTPIIDGLANDGIRFTNAFSTGTVCSPSRTAIITGVKTYKTGTGNHRSAFPIPQDIKGFPYYMQQAGYYTSNNKKTDYNVSDEKAYTKEAWHESADTAGWWNRKGNEPFFAVFNFMDSHQSRTMTHAYSWYKKQVFNQLSEEERTAEDAFEMPPFYKDTPKMRKQFARVYNSLKLTDNKVGALLKRLEADGLKENTIIFFFADHGEGIPRGKTNGINLGYRVPFIAWFPEKYKHLSPWGEAGAVTEELVSFEDLAPTMISLGGGTIPKHMTGRVLAGENRSKETDHLILSSDRADNGIDMVRTVTNGKFIYSRNYMPYLPEARYIRYMEISDIKNQMRKDLKNGQLNAAQKSLFENRAPEVLYNIEADKWELNNLVNDPKYADVLAEMRAQLKQEILSSKDILFLPEFELQKVSKTTTAYDYRLTEDYALEEILECASLSGKVGEEVIGQQLEFLNHSNDIVRYWAAVGLMSQSKEALLPHLVELNKKMYDVYEPVVITISAILYDKFNNKKASDLLKHYCVQPSNDLALLSIHYLMYVQNKQPFVEAVRASREMEGRVYNPKAAAVDFLGSLGLVPNNPSHRQ